MCRSSGLGFRSWRSIRWPPPLWSPSSWQPPRNSDLPLESTQWLSSYDEDIISAKSMLFWIKPWKQSQYLITTPKHTNKIFKILHCHVLYYCAKLLVLTNTIFDGSCALQLVLYHTVSYLYVLNHIILYYCIISHCIVWHHTVWYHKITKQQNTMVHPDEKKSNIKKI